MSDYVVDSCVAAKWILWESSDMTGFDYNKGRRMDPGTIYDTVRRRTRAAFGLPINLHRFRSAAGTFWSIQDPANVRGVKDLLGHESFNPTEKSWSIPSQESNASIPMARSIRPSTPRE